MVYSMIQKLRFVRRLIAKKIQPSRKTAGECGRGKDSVNRSSPLPPDSWPGDRIERFTGRAIDRTRYRRVGARNVEGIFIVIVCGGIHSNQSHRLGKAHSSFVIGRRDPPIV